MERQLLLNCREQKGVMSKMKVLLVDDEMITLKMLKSIIPWEKLGLELMDTADDGEEAYRKVLQEMPDIIISDIRMKNMDGLEFVKKVREISENVKIILMSGYADFDYVKEAIRYGCSNYILKPVDEQELEQSLCKVIAQIRGKAYEKQIRDQSEEQLRIIELLKYMRGSNNKNKILSNKNKYGFDFEGCTLLLIQQQSDSINEFDTASNMELMGEKYAVSMIGDVIGEVYRKKYLYFEEDAWLFLIEKTEEEELLEMIREIIAVFHRELKMQIMVCFSKACTDIDELPQVYEQVMSLQKYGFYIGEEQILGYDYNCVGQEIDELRRIGIFREMEQAVASWDKVQLLELLEEAFELSTIYQPGSQQDIYDFCNKTLYLLKKDISYKELLEYHSLHDLKEFMKRIIEEMSGEENEGKKYSKPISESLKLIEERYNENLSLDDISNAISVSKNYFCYLFKREVGMSLWNYLTMVRLKYARKLLEETNLKAYEIAFQVGYDNPSYFSKMFKRQEGMTPNEYRDSKKS